MGRGEGVYLTKFCFYDQRRHRTPGAPLTYFNDGVGGGPTEVHILYPKNPNFRICLPKKNPTFFSIPKKIPQCFCISKFYYLSSGKLKHANFNFGFGQKQNYKLRLCYFWFELMKNTIPKKIPLLFSRPKKIPASFIDPKKSFRPPPIIKIYEWGPWALHLNLNSYPVYVEGLWIFFFLFLYFIQ